MAGKDHTDEFISKTLDYTLWIEKAEHLLEVASFIEPRIREMWSEVQKGGIIKEHYITTYFMLVSHKPSLEWTSSDKLRLPPAVAHVER